MRKEEREGGEDEERGREGEEERRERGGKWRKVEEE